MAANVYTVASGTPFLTALARALLAGNLPTPGGRPPGALELADITLLLPTRRAARALQEAFLEAAKGAALLLPRIKPLSEGSEDLDLVAGVEHYATDTEGAPRLISGLERHLVLTELVLRWAERMGGGHDESATYAPTAARTPAQAAHLAKELARLMDMLEAQGVGLRHLQDLVPEVFSEHWAQTLTFLQIVTQFWPKHLAEHNLASPIAHRNRRLQAEAERLRSRPPKAPVIVAGVIAADPLARELIEAVLRLPNGALVLPGLDQMLDAESWGSIAPAHPEHPQFGMRRLLEALGLAREQVRLLAGVASSMAQKGRAALTSEAMRPAGTTERWHRFVAQASRKDMAQALGGLSVLEAATAEDEAETIALILREAVEAPGKRAALVTPDPALARRVAARLAAWQVHVVPSAGVDFARTEIGAFLELTAEAAARDFAPGALVTLLKHRFRRPGSSALEVRRGARTLELAVFRAPYFGKGLSGVAEALERIESQPGARQWRHRAVQRLQPIDFDAARRLLTQLEAAFARLIKLHAASTKHSLQALAKAHVEAASALAGGEDLWLGSQGEWAAKFFAGLLDADLTAPAMAAADYVEFYRTLVADKSIRATGPAHPRISIWDPYEAQLRQADIVILGSLNEGTWPRAAEPGPWLNRPMRQALGLPAAEERIGEEAHTFVSLLGAERVYLARAAKVDGVPTVPSRWLLRLQALLAGLGQAPMPDKPWLGWAQQRGSFQRPARPVRAPEPRPSITLRPRQLSVTAIEKWIANPYAIFAERILGLQPLPALGREADAALRGQIVHDALSRFAQRHPDALPKDIEGALKAFAEAALVDYTGSPRVAAFWAPRFARFAAWFAETEPARREGGMRCLAEVEGGMVLAGPAGPFTLKARADRIDVGDGRIVITDYKSSANLQPLASRALQGEAPQLPLEAAIAMAGGFTGVTAGQVATLRYISASGGEPPGNELDLKTGDVAALARATQDGLVRLIAEFDRQATPYRAVRRARFRYDYDDYAHLARVAEWSAESLADGEEAYP